ncbi:hypothetical protein KY385_04880, partial [Candidatus Parcubacteria bacterium]|nr:hypothetical protein [Candidatus Parcubacteria bacterium]
AIRRFYNRTLFITNRPSKEIGEELIIELSQSGYINGNNFSTETTRTISLLVNEHLQLFVNLRKAHVPIKKATDWVLAVLAVKTENLLNPHAYHNAAINFTYYHFQQILKAEDVTRSRQEAEIYEIALFIAVHQALLKSDMDVVRADILNQNNVTGEDIHFFIKWNRQIEEIYISSLTQRLKRTIVKNVAPFRILKSLIEDTPELAIQSLPDREQFLTVYRKQINIEYKQTSKRLNSGIVKGIIFILITKTLIGLAIEIPFELLIYGDIIILPLIISLLFPPIYMASIRLGLKMPSTANARSTEYSIDKLFYSDSAPKLQASHQNRTYSPLAKFTYTILFFLPLGISVWILNSFGFNPLQMFIFFVFFSTATFLGFRLRGMIRELKMSTRHNSLLSILVDFFYLPFILLGQWLSGKYARIDLVGKFLDIVIEMPLKTVLRLIRQWINFLREKHDEIY